MAWGIKVWDADGKVIVDENTECPWWHSEITDSDTLSPGEVHDVAHSTGLGGPHPPLLICRWTTFPSHNAHICYIFWQKPSTVWQLRVYMENLHASNNLTYGLAFQVMQRGSTT